MMRQKLLDCLTNSEQRIDTNKTLAFIGALVGAVILIMATAQKYDGIEWLLSVYLVATMGQLPSKGLNDLGKLRITSKSGENQPFDDVGTMNKPPKRPLPVSETREGY